VLSARRIHSFAPGDRGGAALAIRAGQIVAVAPSWDDLSAHVGPETRVVDDPDLVVLPGFYDTHNHLLWTSSDALNVDVSSARSIPELIRTLADQARRTPPGEWIVAARGWHESTLTERRLPTASELDQATTEHPVLLPRGGHVAVANTPALRSAGIPELEEDPAGGTIVRDATGRCTGVLIEFPAMAPILSQLPVAGFEQRLDALATTCRDYNRHGITAVRDPGVDEVELPVYRELYRRGDLPLRVRCMLRLDATSPLDRNIELLQGLTARPEGDRTLRLDGIKIFADGGVEGGWFDEPYVNDPAYHGEAFYTPDELVRLVSLALSRRWRVGIHALGDRTVRMVLDVYERVLGTLGPLPRGTLTIEHAFMSDAEQRRRAVALGVAVTVQQPLLYALAANMLSHWGPSRTARVMPVADWLADGALVAAGSDCNVAPFDPLLAVWGMVTRGTKVAGPQGTDQAVSRREAFRLYSYSGALLSGDSAWRGRVAVGHVADLVCFRQDPLSCDVDALPDLAPVLTLTDGRPVFDPDGLLT